METQGKLSRWLKERCRREHLSLRQAAAKTRLSHATISDIIKGGHPSPESIMKLAQGFGGNGSGVLGDYLLLLAGYRTEQPQEGGEGYIKTIPLLSLEHQHILEALVRELAKIEGIEMAAGLDERG